MALLTATRPPKYHYLMLTGDENRNTFKHYGLNTTEQDQVESLGPAAKMIEVINSLAIFGYRIVFTIPKEGESQVTYILEKLL